MALLRWVACLLGLAILPLVLRKTLLPLKFLFLKNRTTNGSKVR